MLLFFHSALRAFPRVRGEGWYHYPQRALRAAETPDGRLSKGLICRFLDLIGSFIDSSGAIYDFLFFADAGISDSREAAQGVQPLVAAKPPYRSAGKAPCAEISPRQSAHARKGV